MFNSKPARRGSVFCLGIIATLLLTPCSIEAQDDTNLAKKKLIVPDRISRVPVGNDFGDNESDFSNKRKVEEIEKGT